MSSSSFNMAVFDKDECVVRITRLDVWIKLRFVSRDQDQAMAVFTVENVRIVIFSKQFSLSLSLSLSLALFLVLSRRPAIATSKLCNYGIHYTHPETQDINKRGIATTPFPHSLNNNETITPRVSFVDPYSC